ncbi:MAG: glycosyltransferase [Clostridia bacterium]|nr:glycosyltransferase [Clostridia bacterium]
MIDGLHSGIDTYLLGFCDAAREAGVRLDILTNCETDWLRDRLASYGFGLIAVPDLKHPLAQYRAVRRLIRENRYDAVYVNLSEAFNCMPLLAAKKEGVPHRFAHSHSSGVDRSDPLSRNLRRWIHLLFRRRLSAVCTRRFACSSLAGAWMFKGGFEIVCNAVDGKRFAFREEARRRVREELGLGDRRVFLHVGNFCYAKNQGFLLPVMTEILKKDPGALLLLVGDGAERPALEERAREAGLRDAVRFLGVRRDVADLLSAADAYLFPSRLEGFPITCLEAQFSGIPCVLSRRIAPEIRIAESTSFLEPEDPVAWAEAALEASSRGHGDTLLAESASYEASNNRRQLLSLLKGERV